MRCIQMCTLNCEGELSSVSCKVVLVRLGGISPFTSHMNRVMLLAHHAAKNRWVKHGLRLAGARLRLEDGSGHGICYGNHMPRNSLIV